MPDNVSAADFAAEIKRTHPEMASYDDNSLAHEVLRVHPEYAKQFNVTFDQPKLQASTPVPGSMGNAAAIGANAAMTGNPAGEAGLGAIKGGLHTLYNLATATGLVDRHPEFEQFLKSQSANEALGKTGEQGAEFMGGEGLAKAGMTAIPAVAKLAAASPKIAAAVAGGVSGAAVTKAQGGSNTQAVVNGIFPALFEGATYAGGKLMNLGEKLQTAQIRPNAKDTAAGFNIKNVNKFDLAGSNLSKTLDTTHAEIVSRSNELRDIVQGTNEGEAPVREAADGLAAETAASVKAANLRQSGHAPTLAMHKQAVSDAIDAGKSIDPAVLADYPDLANKARMADVHGPKIDINGAIDNVQKNLLSDASQLKLPADEVTSVKSAIKQYRDWANGLPGGPVRTVDNIQDVKRAVGLKGAWEYGKTSADGGMEKVSNALYSELRGGIEKAVAKESPRLVQINKELGQLMPIEQAVIRRMPVEARNNPLSLTDLMLLATGHPAGAFAHVASRTMAGANAVYGSGSVASRPAPLVKAAVQAAVSGAGSNAVTHRYNPETGKIEAINP